VVVICREQEQAVAAQQHKEQSLLETRAKREQFIEQTRDIRFIPHVEEPVKKGAGRRRKENADDFVDDGA